MTNQRSFFRLEFYNFELDIILPGGITEKGRVRDIGGGGISFLLERNEEFEYCEVRFQIEGERFLKKAKIVRKSINGAKFLYACEFVNLTEKERSKLLAKLLKVDGMRRK